MNETFALAVSALQRDQATLTRVGMNLANATTPGYKRLSPVETTALPQFPRLLERLSDQAPVASTRLDLARPHTDFRPGTFKSTGRALDLALGGDGFFEISTGTGVAYTRQGNFALDAQGRLITGQGHAVMGKGGEIVLDSDAVRIDANGNIFAADAQELPSHGDAPVSSTPLAQLKIVTFEAPRRQDLLRAGAGLLLVETPFAGTDAKPGTGVQAAAGAAATATAVVDGAIDLRQGGLENSNVDALQEMLSMMAAMRHAETMVRVCQGYDDMLGNAIRRLGESP